MDAEVAGPPSPLEANVPLPATVVIAPVLAFTRRIRWLYVSARKRLPVPSMAIPQGWFKDAAVAGPPSPLNVAVPLPAIAVIICPPAIGDCANINRSRHMAL